MGRKKMGKKWMEWSRKCHGLARRLFGTHKIYPSGRAAYDYYIKEFIRNKLGKESRRDLTIKEWEKVWEWLLHVDAVYKNYNRRVRT